MEIFIISPPWRLKIVFVFLRAAAYRSAYRITDMGATYINFSSIFAGKFS